MSNFEENPVNTIRESSRWLVSTRRRAFREETADQIRHLPIPRISSERVLEIINKLKTKSSITADELRLLKNELLENQAYVKILLSTHGALRGLVGELTGLDIRKQCESAGCLINLSLGDEPCCLIIAKMAGSYLVTALDSASDELKATSARALGNLFGPSPKVCELLQSQGVVNKLLGMLRNSDQDGIEAALYALTHYVHNMLDTTSVGDFLESLLHLPQEETIHLVFMLSCHNDFPTTLLINRSIFHKLVNVVQAQYSYEFLSDNTMYVIRISANMCSNKENCDNFLNHVSSEVLFNFLKVIKLLNSKDNDLIGSANWFLSNILFFSSDTELKQNIVNQIGIIS